MKWLFTRAVSLVALSLSAPSRRRSNWSVMAKTVEGIWPCILTLVSAALLLPAGAGAADEWAGIGTWQGQIGDQQVTACFNDARLGAYYDQKQMQAHHHLVADKRPRGLEGRSERPKRRPMERRGRER